MSASLLGYAVGLVLFTTFAATNLARAQSYPTRTIRFIVPASPGSGGDSLARILGLKLTERWGQQVMVDPRPGAGNALATEIGAKSPPDGYTLLLIVNPYTTNPSLRSKLPFDTVKDFSPVTLVGLTPMIFVVHPSVPANSIRELISLAKANPGRIEYASSGTGSTAHLAVELFKSKTGVDMIHIPYKGGGPALNDLLGGQISLGLPSLPLGFPHVRTGKLRVLAVTSAHRSPAITDVPTVSEAGVAGFEAITWYGVVVPAGTPRDIIVKLNAEIVNSLQTPDVRTRFANVGIEPVSSTPERLGAFIVEEIEKWAKVVKAIGVRADD